MQIYSSIEALVGRTPLVRLSGICTEYDITATIAAKLERCNPAGSAKDRIALEMIRTAEENGENDCS